MKRFASKLTGSVFYFSTAQDFQSELIFINKAFQSAVTQNQRNNKDNPATSLFERHLRRLGWQPGRF